eukprot:Skav223169  [mRNA]  locus=scaffold2044:57660:57914:+ [translate_table: standard]
MVQGQSEYENLVKNSNQKKMADNRSLGSKEASWAGSDGKRNVWVAAAAASSIRCMVGQQHGKHQSLVGCAMVNNRTGSEGGTGS